ncbi:MAG: hypothetical protein KGQ88_00795 [Chloroflexi bacterium]|nr:hypothetical protein [Chloroflexota bacterium]
MDGPRPFAIVARILGRVRGDGVRGEAVLDPTRAYRYALRRARSIGPSGAPRHPLYLRGDTAPQPF